MAKKSVCSVCGYECGDEIKFCPNCGGASTIVNDTQGNIPVVQPVQSYSNTTYPQTPAQPTAEPTENFGFSIGGLCTGITALCLSCYSILAIICGVIGIFLCNKGLKSRLPGMAKAGKICSIIAIVLGGVSTIFWIVMIIAGVSFSTF